MIYINTGIAAPSYVFEAADAGTTLAGGIHLLTTADVQTNHRIRRLRTASFATGLYIGLAASALGGTLCPGNYQVLPLAAWPRDVAFNIPLATSSPAADTRAAAFRSGLQQSGVRIDQESPIRLQMVFSVTSSGKDEGVYTGLDWYQVDAEFGTNLKNPGLAGASLTLAAIANNDPERRNVWVATLNCRIQTDDSEQLAHEIGRDIGQLLARSIQSKQ